MLRFSLALALCAMHGSAQEAPKLRLPDSVVPVRYELDLRLAPVQDRYSGVVSIDVEIRRSTHVIWVNSTDLAIDDARIADVKARVLEAKPEFVGFAFDKALPTGRAKLTIRFNGALNKKDVEGLFKQSEGGASYIFTQFEPTSARRAFPCFDEPHMKVPWKITLRVPKSDKAFANTPQISEQAESDGMKTVRFQESKPMPSYLVAVAVGPFDVVDGGTAGAKKIPLRVLAPQGRGAEAAYASEVTPKIFNLLEKYFGLSYPYEKLDQAAIPVTVGFGAMENAGLITYQQTLLLARKEDDTISRRRDVAEVIAHELAHQWFGNMVTPMWWDDIWLNEAFASWIELKVLAELYPEWKTNVEVVADKSGAMAKDSLLTARRIRQPIENEGDIGNAFDSITYQKGAAVIRMFEEWLGPEVFRQGIQAYMAKHAWGNATATDFLNSISAVAKRDVTRAFSTFLDRNGLPMLSFNLRCDGGKPRAVVSQERFLPIGSKGDRKSFWQVPVCIKYENGATVVRQCALLADPKDEVVLENASGCPEWIYASDDASGYYRVKYEGDLQSKLVANVSKLALNETVELLKNTEALLSAGQMPADQALELVRQFRGARDREVIAATLSIVLGIRKAVPSDLVSRYERFVRDMYGERARKLGWSPKPGESEDDKILRTLLVPAVAGDGREEQLIAEAKVLAQKWLTDRKAVAPEMVAPVLGVTAAFGDRAIFNQLVAELRRTKDRRERNRLVNAIGSFRDPAIARDALALLFASDLDVRDLTLWLTSFQANEETERVAWDFMTANYDKLLTRLPSRLGTHAGSNLPFSGSFFCDEKGRTEVESFFKERIKTVTGGERNLAQVIETISLCGPRRATLQPGIVKFLSNYQAGF